MDFLYDQRIMLNVAFFLQFIALSVKDILFLRVIIMSAQAIFLSYALVTLNPIVGFWNSVFILLNSYQVFVLLRDRRPIRLEGDLLDIYNRFFFIMTRKEFLKFWHHGKVETLIDEMLIRKNERQKKIMMVIDGKAAVYKKGKEIASLSRGNFIAEMSYLTDEPTSADVKAIGYLKYIIWHQNDLEKINKIYPETWNKILGIIGRDLVEKVKQTSARI